MYKKCRKLLGWCLVTCMVLTQTYITGFAASGVTGQTRLSKYYFQHAGVEGSATD